MLNKLKEKAGYVSIETVIIAGLMLALGVAIVISLFAKGEEIQGVADTKIQTALDTVTGTNPGDATAPIE